MLGCLFIREKHYHPLSFLFQTKNYNQQVLVCLFGYFLADVKILSEACPSNRPTSL